jgi:hypothetical protein
MEVEPRHVDFRRHTAVFSSDLPAARLAPYAAMVPACRWQRREFHQSCYADLARLFYGSRRPGAAALFLPSPIRKSFRKQS